MKITKEEIIQKVAEMVLDQTSKKGVRRAAKRKHQKRPAQSVALKAAWARRKRQIKSRP